MMLARPLVSLGGGVCIGPCPACENWQLDYLPDVPPTYGTTMAFTLVIEDALREHYDECAPLREMVGPLPE